MAIQQIAQSLCMRSISAAVAARSPLTDTVHACVLSPMYTCHNGPPQKTTAAQHNCTATCKVLVSGVHAQQGRIQAGEQGSICCNIRRATGWHHCLQEDCCPGSKSVLPHSHDTSVLNTKPAP